MNSNFRNYPHPEELREFFSDHSRISQFMNSSTNLFENKRSRNENTFEFYFRDEKFLDFGFRDEVVL